MINLKPHHSFTKPLAKAIKAAEDKIKIFTSKPPQSRSDFILSFTDIDFELMNIVSLFSYLLTVKRSKKLSAQIEKISEIANDFYAIFFANDDLYHLLIEFRKNSMSKLSSVDLISLNDQIRSFESYRLTKAKKNGPRLAAIEQKIEDLQMSFSEALIQSEEAQFLKIKKGDLEKCFKYPEIKKFKKNDDSIYFEVPLKDGIYRRIVNTHPDSKVRQQMWVAYHLRGKDKKTNAYKILTDLAKARFAKAKSLGFKNYVDFASQQSFFKNSKEIKSFITDQINHFRHQSNLQLGRLLEADIKNLLPWDYTYLRAQKEKVALSKLDGYFEFNQTLHATVKLLDSSLGLKFKKLNHNKISPIFKNSLLFEVFNRKKKRLAILEIDPFARENKEPGAAVSVAMKVKEKFDQKSIPYLTLRMDLEAPINDSPAFLHLDGYRKLFHELGHVVQEICGYSELRFLNKTPFPDLVEFPSVLFELWGLTPDVLQTVARHYKTNKKLAVKQVNLISKSIEAFNHFDSYWQLGLSLLDLEIHSAKIFNKSTIDKIETAVYGYLATITSPIPVSRSSIFDQLSEETYAGRYYTYSLATAFANSFLRHYDLNNSGSNGLASNLLMNELLRDFNFSRLKI